MTDDDSVGYGNRPLELRSGDDFLRRFQTNLIIDKNGFTRSHVVCELFGCGFTRANQLLRWLGYNPDEKVNLRSLK